MKLRFTFFNSIVDFNKRLPILILILIVHNLVYGQSLDIVGPTNVDLNGTYHYYIPNFPEPINSYTWDPTGIIISENSYSVDIKWDEPGENYLYAEFYGSSNTYVIDLIVTVVDPNPVPYTPNAPYRPLDGCGDAVVKKTGSIPENVTWYWQTQPNGTSTSDSSSSITVSSSQTVYLRARHDISGLWSVSSSYLVVNIKPIPAVPSPASVTNNCGSSLLTRGNPPSAITWYWQSSVSGTSTSNSSASVTRTTGSTYYLRAKWNNTDCWSTARAINYSIQQPTLWYADTDGDAFGDPNVTQNACSQPAGYVDNNLDRCPEEYGEVEGCLFTPYDLSLSDENYVYIRQYQVPTTTQTVKYSKEVVEVVNYYDALGRPKQKIETAAGGIDAENYVNELSMDWSAGTGSAPFFNQNGSASENNRLTGVDPSGGLSLLWKCGNDIESNADGGWNTDYFNVDKSTGYRYTVWVKRTGSQNGTTYHGTNNVSNLAGTVQSNPYFWYGDLPQLDTWYLIVGIIYPYDYAGEDQGISGVYDQQGNKVLDGTEFKWNSNTTTARFRSYLDYSTDLSTNQFFWNPIVQRSDGNETLLSDLINDQQGKPADIVTHIEHDQYGRQAKMYLPFASGTLAGSYKTINITEDIHQYYKNRHSDDFPGVALADVNAYSESIYEASPLDRVLEKAAPGKTWKADPVVNTDHTIKFDRNSNGASEVVFFSVDFPNSGDTSSPVLVKNGNYNANELYATIIKDENWQPGQAYIDNHTTREYKDKLGRLILKRTYNASEVLNTYYVYDDFGNLSFVLPPKVDVNDGVSQEELSKLCYQYRYDHRNRAFARKLPGKGWEYTIFNELDLPVLTQDGNQRSKDEWLFTKYDVLNRTISTGTLHDSGSRTVLQQTVDRHFATNDFSWDTHSGVVFNGDQRFTKTATDSWGNAILASLPIAGAGEDAMIMIEAQQTDKGFRFGFDDSSDNTVYNDIDHSIYVQVTGALAIYEGPTSVYSLPSGAYDVGDLLSIERVNGVVYYKRNGELLHTSSVASNGSIKVSTVVHSNNTELYFPKATHEDTGTMFGYSNYSFPFTSKEEDYLTITYYDDYTFHHASLSEYQFKPSEAHSTYFDGVKGQVTGTMTRILGSRQWLRNITYYDDRYRVIQAINDNHLGGSDCMTNTYDFVGKVLESKTKHTTPEPILWRNRKSVREVNSIFTGLASSSGFSSVNTLDEDQDGWVSTVVTSLTGSRVFGLNDNDLNTSVADIDYPVNLYNDVLRVFEPVSQWVVVGSLELGDVIKLSREGGSVKVYQNDVLVHTFSTATTGALVIDTWLAAGSELAYLDCSFSFVRQATAPYDILWTGLSRVTQSYDTLTKDAVGGWNGGASSVNRLAAGYDGWVSFKSMFTDKALMVGLSRQDMSIAFNSIEYALSLQANGQIVVYEKGVLINSFGTYQVGDDFRVERNGTQVTYLHNGTPFYTSTTSSATDLIVDVSLSTAGAAMSDLYCSFGLLHPKEKNFPITRQFDYDHAERLINTWHSVPEHASFTDVVGVEVQGNSMVKTTLAAGYNAGAATVNTIPANKEGWISMEVIGDNYVLFGLSDVNTGTDYQSIDYALLTNPIDQRIVVYEGGTSRGIKAYYEEGDILKVAREGETIRYYRNEQELHTSTLSSTSALIGDFSLYNQGDRINNVQFMGAPILLAHNEYNELGELIEKNLHQEPGGTDFAQSVDYRYNIRGWLTNINNAALTSTTVNDDTNQNTDYWGMELGYNTQLTGVNAVPSYNGNISGAKWSDRLGQRTKAYAYDYDPMNRLIDADHSIVGQTNGPAFDVSIRDGVNSGYDLNGNIKALSRGGTSGAGMDVLTYNYGTGSARSNQLLAVTDAGDTAGFRDGNTTGNDYGYDANGNMTQDLNKDITAISYNHLNLPETVEKTDGQLIYYTYDAGGIKLKQEVHETVLQDQSFTPSELILWSPSNTFRSVISGPIGGESNVLRVYAGGQNSLHRLLKYMEPLQGKRVRVKAKLYLPSGNTNVDGVQIGIGAYNSAIYTATDQWLDIEYFLDDVENTNDGFVYFHMVSGGNQIFTGANSVTDDLFYLKDIEVSTVEPVKTTDYIGEFIYEDGEIALIQHEEGRIVFDPVTEVPEYQYHLKDHLGNTRVTFTTKPKTIEFTANYENNPAVPDDLGLFEKVDHTTLTSNDLFDHTDATGTIYTYTQLLTGGLNSQIGSVIAIPVGMGDTLHAEVFAKYKDNSGNGNNSGALALANLLVTAFTGGTGYVNELGNQSIHNNFQSGALIGTTGFAPEDSDAPMAFLNVMFLPEGELVSLDSAVSFAYDQIDAAAQQPNTSVKAAHDRLHVDNFQAPSNGYILVYVSNESSMMTEVYFDDLKITVNEHPVIQTDNYYPFGMAHGNGYQRVTAQKNKFKYNGFELQTALDWGVYDYQARYYDPQIGRFLMVDPAADLMRRHSPYNYAFDNPIRFVDPDGMMPGDGIFGGFVSNLATKAKNYVAAKVNEAIVNTGRAIVQEVRSYANDLEISFYGKAEGKLTTGPRIAGEIKGVGFDVDLGSKEIESIEGELTVNVKTGEFGADGNIDYTLENGNDKYTEGGSVGYLVEGEYKEESLQNSNGEVVKEKSSGSMTVGVGVGAKFTLESGSSEEFETQSLKGGAAFGGKVGAGFVVEGELQLGLKIERKVERD
ncbi:RHS repeat-associated core domain-containing protein [Fulvivirga sp. M361]|uniref:DUF6443 domain-containing protein n=1 Tax=Fulvivirga sp. M361 TaxID=2594266 RepID=UPI00117ACB7E|nr:DUF6443 domain-containing protein [Fulvivirga sp. M361]TRX50873.1 RHS repeat-associated core domain-containing protein [Fulvivirga sp. M361]